MKKNFLSLFICTLIVNITISAQVYTIIATAGTGGSISPFGSVNVNGGDYQSFTITPDAGYQIADVLVDNVSVGVVSNYSFTDVSSNHTINATFIVIDSIIYGISGPFEIVEMPASLDAGEFISQTHIRVMHEGLGIVSNGMPNLAYDGAYHNPNLGTGSGTFGNAIIISYSGPGLPAGGTEVNSILLHFDPDVSGLQFSLTQGISQSGTITFNRPIIGVYVTGSAIAETDEIFTPSGVVFSTDSRRGMEFAYNGDQYLISEDRYELSLTMFAHNGGYFDEMRIILGANPSLKVMSKIFLEGPYSSSSMSTSLNSELPTTQPYSDLPWSYAGSENVESGFFTNHTNIADWVLVELRSDETTVVSSRAAFITDDGSIVNLDGTSPVKFNAFPGNYYIVIKHRNHLAVMSASKVSLPNVIPYDFTLGDGSQFYPGDGEGAKQLEPGIWGMAAGDANGDEQVTTLDYDAWLSDARSSATGYINTDMNLDGQTTTLDYDVWLPNAREAKISQVP